MTQHSEAQAFLRSSQTAEEAATAEVTQGEGPDVCHSRRSPDHDNLV